MKDFDAARVEGRPVEFRLGGVDFARKVRIPHTVTTEFQIASNERAKTKLDSDETDPEWVEQGILLHLDLIKACVDKPDEIQRLYDEELIDQFDVITVAGWLFEMASTRPLGGPPDSSTL